MRRYVWLHVLVPHLCWHYFGGWLGVLHFIEVDLVDCLACCIAGGAYVALRWAKVVAGLVVWNRNFMVALCPTSRVVG